MKTELISLNELADNEENCFVVVAIDETEYWREDLKKKAGKIEGVYLVNLKMPTHLCELSVSFPAVHLRNFVPDIAGFEGGSDNQELQDIEGDYDNEISYFKGSNRYYPRKIYTNEMTEDEILEHEQGNPTVC